MEPNNPAGLQRKNRAGNTIALAANHDWRMDMKRDRFPPLKLQEEIDRERTFPPGWWVLPGLVVGMAFWAAVGVMIAWW